MAKHKKKGCKGPPKNTAEKTVSNEEEKTPEEQKSDSEN